MDETTANPPILSYAAPSKRRKWIFRAFGLLLILVGIFGGWKWGPAAWTQVKYVYWQRQCLNYTAPPNQVVYDEDPTAAAKLLANSADYVAYINQSLNPPGTSAIFRPRCWREFDKLSPTIDLTQVTTPVAVVFCHEMKSPAGHRRLVFIRCFPFTLVNARGIGGYSVMHMFEISVIPPTTWTKAPVNIPQVVEARPLIISQQVAPPLTRIYAGQVDPNDPSHVTFESQTFGKSQILDARLDDNDQVTITLRN